MGARLIVCICHGCLGGYSFNIELTGRRRAQLAGGPVERRVGYHARTVRCDDP